MIFCQSESHTSYIDDSWNPYPFEFALSAPSQSDSATKVCSTAIKTKHGLCLTCRIENNLVSIKHRDKNLLLFNDAAYLLMGEKLTIKHIYAYVFPCQKYYHTVVHVMEIIIKI